jgi:hypothetical protein
MGSKAELECIAQWFAGESMEQGDEMVVPQPHASARGALELYLDRGGGVRLAAILDGLSPWPEKNLSHAYML